jgi:hypothetical protein
MLCSGPDWIHLHSHPPNRPINLVKWQRKEVQWHKILFQQAYYAQRSQWCKYSKYPFLLCKNMLAGIVRAIVPPLPCPPTNPVSFLGLTPPSATALVKDWNIFCNSFIEVNDLRTAVLFSSPSRINPQNIKSIMARTQSPSVSLVDKGSSWAEMTYRDHCYC